MMTWNEPDFDPYEKPQPEAEWPGELPESVEAWLEHMHMSTLSREELRHYYRMTPPRLTPKAAA